MKNMTIEEKVAICTQVHERMKEFCDDDWSNEEWHVVMDVLENFGYDPDNNDDDYDTAEKIVDEWVNFVRY